MLTSLKQLHKNMLTSLKQLELHVIIIAVEDTLLEKIK